MSEKRAKTHFPHQGPEAVRHLRLRPGMSVGALAREMGGTGVLGGGRVGAAVDVLTEMFGNTDFTNFMTVAGPMVPSGFRLLIGDMVERGFLDAIVTTGANLTHDVIEALGLHHYRGSFNVDDRKLLREGYNRIADIFVREEAFEKLDKRVRKIVKNIPLEERRNISYSILLEKIGSRLSDRDSILRRAATGNVRIFSPGLLDSILGLSIWSFSQTETLGLNPLTDVTRMVEMCMASRKLGVLILGGGLPKHNTLLASVLREGVDAAVQITADRPEPGGLSGAPLAESISWRKIRKGGKFVDVYGDATLCFPLIMAAVLEKVKSRERRTVQ